MPRGILKTGGEANADDAEIVPPAAVGLLGLPREFRPNFFADALGEAAEEFDVGIEFPVKFEVVTLGAPGGLGAPFGAGGAEAVKAVAQGLVT